MTKAASTATELTASRDGRARKLTNGLGGTLIRQCKPYPGIRIAAAELKAEDVPRI